MESKIDLKAYFERIGYRGEPGTNLETLKELHRLHTRHIPFENINSFLGLPVKLDIPTLQEKMVFKRRGGYCFEQNVFFMEVLRSLGFTVRGLAGRVLWDKPEDEITRRTHMLLLIYLNNINYIADVGFGAMTLTGPIRLEPGVEQSTPHESFRCEKPEEGVYFLQAYVKNTWKTLYRFGMGLEFLIDYEMANWFLSNYPESHFTTNLMVSRTDEGIRYTLHNKDLNVYRLNGENTHEQLHSPDEIKNKLEEVFDIDIHGIPKLDHGLEKIVALEENMH